MGKGMKTFLLVCAGVFLVGMIAFTVGFALNGWQGLSKLPGDWHIEKTDGHWEFIHGDTDRTTKVLEGADATFDALDLDLSFCSVTYSEGTEYKITIITDPDFTEPTITLEDGVLVLRDQQTTEGISVDNKDYATEIKITVPEGTKLDSARLHVNLGLLDIQDIETGSLDLSLSMGELTARGLAFEEGTFDFEICSAVLELSGNESDYDYDINGDLGSVELAGRDVTEETRDTGAARHFSLDLSLADAEIDFR